MARKSITWILRHGVILVHLRSLRFSPLHFWVFLDYLFTIWIGQISILFWPLAYYVRGYGILFQLVGSNFVQVFCFCLFVYDKIKIKGAIRRCPTPFHPDRTVDGPAQRSNSGEDTDSSLCQVYFEMKEAKSFFNKKKRFDNILMTYVSI